MNYTNSLDLASQYEKLQNEFQDYKGMTNNLVW